MVMKIKILGIATLVQLTRKTSLGDSSKIILTSCLDVGKPLTLPHQQNQ